MREWVLKGIGAVFLLASSLGIGLRMIEEDRRRFSELGALLRLIRHIRENIGTLRRPLPQIYEAFCDPCLEENGFLPILRKRGFRAAAEETPWRQDEDVTRVLTEFAASLGQGYTDEEVSLCRYTETKLADALAALEKAAPDREKLRRTLPALLALSVILLLL